MKKNKKKTLISILAIIAALAFLAIALLPTFVTAVRAASTQAQLKEKLAQSQQKKEKAQQELANLDVKKKAVEADKASLDAEITEIEDQVNVVNQSIWDNEWEISQKEDEIALQEEKIGKYNDAFTSRARVMYKRGTTSYLDVLFGANDFTDLLYKIQMIKKIMEYDRDVLQDMADAKQLIVDSKTAIEEEKQQKELNRQILENSQGELESKLAERQSVLNEINSDAARAKQIEDEEDAQMQEIRNQLAAMSSSGRASSTSSGPSVVSNGSMQWPSASSKTITSPYGYRYHPIQHVTRFHSGIDIGASYGTSVLAAESGKVIMASWNGGYGKCVVIDHGGGIYTLYGHNSQLNVSVGQSVSRGQTIALVGSTGNSTGPHIHFEVLINGSTTNPLSYVG